MLMQTRLLRVLQDGEIMRVGATCAKKMDVRFIAATNKDIVEEIVGEINDETDRDRELVTILGAGQWRCDGRFPVEDAVELGWPLEESDDYETVAGWLIHTLDFVPKVGDEFVVDGFSFKVEKMRRSRISVIRVKQLEEAPAAPAATD